MGGGQKLPEEIKLPIIDFANITQANSKSRANEAQKLIDAFTQVGFCLIANVPNYQQDQIFEAIK